MPPLLLSAAITPLRDGGASLDLDAVGPLWEYLRAGGADGVFCCGTTGEGVLLTHEERQAMAIAFREACDGRLIVHAGAQTTAGTAALANHAASIGADGVAVIPPPYYPLDDDALVEHMCTAAAACEPLPFYLYAFAARSGYPLRVEVVRRVQERASNVAGLKVSESPFSAIQPYLELDLPVLVGSEPLIPEALAAGAAGSVSGLASAFPQTVRAALDDPGERTAAPLRELRDRLGSASFIAGLKHELGLAGVPVRGDMRAPLRPWAD
jgi:2-dehydro-3-deoxy-phosphogluconate/2-dehydro-3-deoxy-6-phosphogalactonate aldolase